jgi:hypothetical protein
MSTAEVDRHRLLEILDNRAKDFAAYAAGLCRKLAARPPAPSPAAIEAAFDAHLREWKKVPRPDETRQSDAEVRALMQQPMEIALVAAYAVDFGPAPAPEAASPLREPSQGPTEAPFATLVRNGIAKARAKHKNINSAHEAYAVILEELDEFWDVVKSQDWRATPADAATELVHVAAMAQRAYEDVVLNALAAKQAGKA